MIVQEKNFKIELYGRTKRFSIAIINLFSSLPTTTVAQVLGKQLLRSGTSIGAHYSEAIHARSNAELIAKIDLGLQELRETGYWLDLLMETNIVGKEKIRSLHDEKEELLSILISISKKLKAKKL